MTVKRCVFLVEDPELLCATLHKVYIRPLLKSRTVRNRFVLNSVSGSTCRELSGELSSRVSAIKLVIYIKLRLEFKNYVKLSSALHTHWDL